MTINPATVTPEDLRKALCSLAVAASGFTGGRGREIMRDNLKKEIHKANQVLKAVIVEKQTESSPSEECDPEKLICNYIEAGGSWQQLAAAVNRLALRGATKQ